MNLERLFELAGVNIDNDLLLALASVNRGVLNLSKLCLNLSKFPEIIRCSKFF